MNAADTPRQVLQQSTGRPASDGAGVNLIRVFAERGDGRFDPFLMLDEFGSANPDDYVAGFPAHPHRGFETVTYMLEGRMRHEDHLGNLGLLRDGGVQWMTAARGIIHSEMPEQQAGVMRGFQLWLNLPGKDKLSEPSYRDFDPSEIPRLRTSGGVEVKVIAGRYEDGEISQPGAVQRPHTDPQMFDLDLPPGGRAAPRLPDGHRLLLYAFEGELEVNGTVLSKGGLALLAERGSLELASGGGARVLLLAGRPLGEPIVQYGPFVMNTREEIDQAVRDFRAGQLTG
ncbi:pirin family protein [Pseudomonas sp. RIT-PI-AD]|uniref:pirin family protein n=1 Tax=Pseudomonas sp. RIT-PI-AD TaxID=3035294 RepID=UPI0021D89B8D|nr:pirin family protein [Pseudomonas sp. RIT-PI-AD]